MKNKKYYLFSLILAIGLLMLLVFKGANYDTYDFRLSMKALFGQELTYDEMKNSGIYRAYEQIECDTDVNRINSIFNKENNNLGGTFEAWQFPYGYVSCRYSSKDEERVLNKLVDFKIPHTTDISEEDLKLLLESSSFEEMKSLLGDPGILGVEYNSSGDITNHFYEWGIESRCETSDDKEKFRLSAESRDEVRIDKVILNAY